MISIPSKVDANISKQILTKYSFSTNKWKLKEGYDLFICNSGYESRTLGFLKNAINVLQLPNSIVFIFHPKESNLYVKNLRSLGSIRQHLNQISKNTEIRELDPTNPWQFRQVMKDLLNKYKITQKSRILVDITSFTRVFLYELIYSLYKSGCSFTFAYTEPQDYVTTLPSGVNRVIISPSFVGKPRPNKKAFLILFFGWETGRSRDTFENYNSDDHIGVFGVAPIDKKHIRWQMESYKRNKELMRKLKEVDACSTLDLDEIICWLRNIYETKQQEFKQKNEKYYFAMTGSGPKIQNVAVCFFAIRKKDIQLVYGTPAYWGPIKINMRDMPISSRGIGRTYVYGPYSKNSITKLIP